MELPQQQNDVVIPRNLLGENAVPVTMIGNDGLPVSDASKAALIYVQLDDGRYSFTAEIGPYGATSYAGDAEGELTDRKAILEAMGVTWTPREGADADALPNVTDLMHATIGDAKEQEIDLGEEHALAAAMDCDLPKEGLVAEVVPGEEVSYAQISAGNDAFGASAYGGEQGDVSAMQNGSGYIVTDLSTTTADKYEGGNFVGEVPIDEAKTFMLDMLQRMGVTCDDKDHVPDYASLADAINELQSPVTPREGERQQDNTRER